jgi:signal peptidase II
LTRKFALCVAVACGVLLLDIISKVAIVATLRQGQRVVWLGGLLTLQLYRNPGAAFGVGASYTIIIAAIAVGTIVFILRTARRLRSTGWAISFGLLLGGAAGNLSDRLVRAPGFLRGDVIDWIKLPLFPPTFNLADTSITFGAILAVLLAMRGTRIEGGRSDGTDGSDDADGEGAGGDIDERGDARGGSHTAGHRGAERGSEGGEGGGEGGAGGDSPDGGVTDGAGTSPFSQIDSAKIPHHAGAGGTGMGEADTERPPAGGQPADVRPADGQALDGRAPGERRRQAS